MGQNLLKSVEYFVSDKFKNHCWKSDKVYIDSDFQYVEQIPLIFMWAADWTFSSEATEEK